MRRTTRGARRRRSLPPLLRARVARGFGSSADPAGEDEVAERALRGEPSRSSGSSGTRPAVAHMLLRLGASALKRGDVLDRRTLLEDSVARSREVGSEGHGGAGDRDPRPRRRQADGDHELALERFEQSATVARGATSRGGRRGIRRSRSRRSALELGRIDERGVASAMPTLGAGPAASTTGRTSVFAPRAVRRRRGRGGRDASGRDVPVGRDRGRGGPRPAGRLESVPRGDRCGRPPTCRRGVRTRPRGGPLASLDEAVEDALADA